MTSACVCVVLKWFRRLWESVGGSKSWWVLCRTHWGLSETFQTSTDEKGVAAGWRALEMRVFICSWMKLKYPWQELCCCYYCLISLSLGGISGSLPNSGWNQPSPSYKFTGLSGSSRLSTLSLQPKCPTWQSRVGGATEARQRYRSVWKAAWLSDTPLLGPLRCKSRGGNDVATDMALWSGEVSQTVIIMSCPSRSFECHLPSAATSAWVSVHCQVERATAQLRLFFKKIFLKNHTYKSPPQHNTASVLQRWWKTQAFKQRDCAVGQVLLTKVRWSCRRSRTSSASIPYKLHNDRVCCS